MRVALVADTRYFANYAFVVDNYLSYASAVVVGLIELALVGIELERLELRLELLQLVRLAVKRAVDDVVVDADYMAFVEAF